MAACVLPALRPRSGQAPATKQSLFAAKIASLRYDDEERTKSEILTARTKQFAISIIKLFRVPPKTEAARVIGRQGCMRLPLPHDRKESGKSRAED